MGNGEWGIGNGELSLIINLFSASPRPRVPASLISLIPRLVSFGYAVIERSRDSITAKSNHTPLIFPSPLSTVPSF
ncbi:MAG: hypothetical protein KME21_02625 [Desmonostoc vinosum HA7617-LM4]|nr:hypothetical protein [Desmonostoc vinosum HA7617-LM4]